MVVASLCWLLLLAPIANTKVSTLAQPNTAHHGDDVWSNWRIAEDVRFVDSSKIQSSCWNERQEGIGRYLQEKEERTYILLFDRLNTSSTRRERLLV